MPSTSKTGHLGLNRWIGTDKPKKDDFNGDNNRIDTACKAMAEQIAALEVGAGPLAAHLANTGVHTTSGEKAAWNAHRTDAGVHVTAEEKELWNSGAVLSGSYTGNGSGSRNLTFGFQPRFGLLYAVDRGPVHSDWSGYESKVYAGFFGKNGCSQNIALRTNGITLSHNATKPIDGCSYKYNETGVTYIWAAWP